MVVPLPGARAHLIRSWFLRAQKAVRCGPAGVLVPRFSDTHHSPTRVRMSGSPPGLRGRCRRGRAGLERASERAARSKRRAGGRRPPRTGGLVGGLRRAGLGDGGRAARERAGGVAAATAGDARSRCPRSTPPWRCRGPPSRPAARPARFQACWRWGRSAWTRTSSWVSPVTSCGGEAR